MVELRIPGDKVLLLEEGKLDTASWLAFLSGHCHSLALALNACTGWALVAIDDAAAECVHVAVRSPADRIVDITGAHAPAQMLRAITGGGRIRSIDKDELDRLPETHGWVEPAPAAATAWVEPVLARIDEEPLEPMRPPVLRLTRETARGIEVRVSWDGEPGFSVDVRAASPPEQPFARYGHITFPKDEDGIWRIEFYEKPFANLAETWLCRSFDERRAERVLREAQRSLGPNPHSSATPAE
jgi:hypothetical protein